MGLLGKLFGGGIVSAAEGVAGIVDKFVETPDEKAAAEIIKAKLMMRPSLAQIELNKIEAGHRSLFVAGWRPWIGWTCGFALGWHYILHDLMAWACAIYSPEIAPPELAGTQELVTVLLAMLGLGAFRTAEKMGGRAK